MKKLSLANAKIKKIELYKKYMFFIGFAGQAVFYLQAWESFTTKNAEGVSLMGFCFGLISVSSWLVYGIILRDPPLIYANVCGVIGAVIAIISIVMYS